MLFVAIGLTILFISFLIAVVSLIREFGQRSSDDGLSYDDYQGLELADEVVPVSSIADQSTPTGEEINLASQTSEGLAGEEPERLEETVPFPWEMQSNFSDSDQVSTTSEIETNEFDMGPTFKLSSDKPYGEVTLADLRQKG